MPAHYVHPEGGLSMHPIPAVDPEDLKPVVSAPKPPVKRRSKKDEPVADQQDSPPVGQE